MQDGWQIEVIVSLTHAFNLDSPQVQNLLSPMAIWETVKMMADSKDRIAISGM